MQPLCLKYSVLGKDPITTCRVEKDTCSYWMLTIELQIINHMYRLRFSGPIPDLRLIVIELKPIEPKSVRILAQWNESGQADSWAFEHSTD